MQQLQVRKQLQQQLERKQQQQRQQQLLEQQFQFCHKRPKTEQTEQRSERRISFYFLWREFKLTTEYSCINYHRGNHLAAKGAAFYQFPWKKLACFREICQEECLWSVWWGHLIAALPRLCFISAKANNPDEFIGPILLG
ncbi:MAG: hypothetical protein AAB278_05580 [Pseudomonadota bacterium]